jgi:competence protein ComEC
MHDPNGVIKVGSLMMNFVLPLLLFANLAADIDKVNLNLKEGEIAVTFLDLPSGEATLIQDANGENILINTGGPSTSKQLDKILQKYNVSSFKAVIITKYDKYYTSNLPWILKKYTVDKIITGSKIFDGQDEEDKIMKWAAGEKHEILPNTMIQILHDSKDKNERQGMDFSLRYGRNHFLFMTSADHEVENQLKRMTLSDVDILKIADFGSKIGTTQPFLEYVDPHVAVIFSKKGMMPSEDVMERLYESWIDIYQTKQFGNITIKCDEKHYEIITISLESFKQHPLTF